MRYIRNAVAAEIDDRKCWPRRWGRKRARRHCVMREGLGIAHRVHTTDKQHQHQLNTRSLLTDIHPTHTQMSHEPSLGAGGMSPPHAAPRFARLCSCPCPCPCPCSCPLVKESTPPCVCEIGSIGKLCRRFSFASRTRNLYVDSGNAYG